MPSYDIRLCKRDGAKPTYRMTETNDFAAICAARKIAEYGDQVEVWRGMDCIYAAQECGSCSLSSKLERHPITVRSNA
jgi:hypothetical protein